MRVLWRMIAGIFKWTWRVLNFVREFILNLFLILLIVVGVGIWLHVSSANAPAEVQKGALIFDLSGVVVDKPSVSNKLSKIGRQLLGASSDRLKENSLFDVVDAIRQAKDDDKITGMVLDLHNFAGADQPSLQYIGKALREFRDSGKPIYARGDSYSQAQYYLASFANKIYPLAAGHCRSARFCHQQPLLQNPAGQAESQLARVPRRYLQIGGRAVPA